MTTAVDYTKMTLEEIKATNPALVDRLEDLLVPETAWKKKLAEIQEMYWGTFWADFEKKHGDSTQEGIVDLEFRNQFYKVQEYVAMRYGRDSSFTGWWAILPKCATDRLQEMRDKIRGNCSEWRKKVNAYWDPLSEAEGKEAKKIELRMAMKGIALKQSFDEIADYLPPDLREKVSDALLQFNPNPTWSDEDESDTEEE